MAAFYILIVLTNIMFSSCYTIGTSVGDMTKCSKYHFEEKVLEKLVRLEHKMELLEEKIKLDMQKFEESDIKRTSNTETLRKNMEAELESQKRMIEDVILNVTVQAENISRELKIQQDDAFKGLLLGASDDSAYKIAFDAVLSHNLDHSGIIDTTIVYDSVLTNIGGAYHKDTGVFVAPVKGVYLFAYTIHGDGASDIWGSLAINGNKMTSVQADGSGRSLLIPSASRTTIFALNKDDRVYIQILKGSRGLLTSASYRHSSFAGVLLFSY